MSAERFAPLARVWYLGRLAHDYEPRSPEAAEALLSQHGLTGEFWRLR
ncbi:MAG: hypothetical protein R3E10_17365 [Gemmatimonadota bacterium]